LVAARDRIYTHVLIRSSITEPRFYIGKSSSSGR